MDFYDAWQFLVNHPMTRAADGYDSYFYSCLDIYVEKVNPETGRIDEDSRKNTKTEVWLEFGPWVKWSELSPLEQSIAHPEGTPSHDVDLDCEADTFEKAICMLAEKVLEHYGSYENDA